MKISFPVFVLRLLLLLMLPLSIVAQVKDSTDSVPKRQPPVAQTRVVTDTSAITTADTTVMAKDTVKPVTPAVPDTTLQAFYQLNQHVFTNAPLVFRNEEPFIPHNKDAVFYLLAGMLFSLGLVRIIFTKYFSDLFRIFFKSSFRQRSLREQLLQNTMASLILNVFFCVSGGLFLYYVALYNGWLGQAGLWEKAGICVGLVSAIYGTKYIGLQLSGWLFGMKDVTETYLFIVFLINKVVGIMLLPTIIILSLGNQALHPVLLVSSLILLLILYLYRYIIALPLVRNHSGLTGFHFFVYLCAFEIVPLLLIYKLLLLILGH